MAREFIVRKRREWISKYVEGFKPLSLRQLHEACVKSLGISDDTTGYNLVAKDIQVLKQSGQVDRESIIRHRD